jgi:hypothetical protein
MGRKRKAKDPARDDGSDTEEESSAKKRTTRGGDKKKSFRELGKTNKISSVFVLFKLFHFQSSLRWTPRLMKILMSAQCAGIGMIQTPSTTRTG